MCVCGGGVLFGLKALPTVKGVRSIIGKFSNLGVVR